MPTLQPLCSLEDKRLAATSWQLLQSPHTFANIYAHPMETLLVGRQTVYGHLIAPWYLIGRKPVSLRLVSAIVLIQVLLYHSKRSCPLLHYLQPVKAPGATFLLGPSFSFLVHLLFRYIHYGCQLSELWRHVGRSCPRTILNENNMCSRVLFFQDMGHAAFLI